MILTIPKKLVEDDEVVIVSKKEYEKLFHFWSSAERLEKREKLAIEKGFREIQNGKYFTSKEVKKELGL